MTLCPKCSRSRWPFAIVFVISTVIAFTTWLILGLSTSSALLRLAISGSVFLVVGGTLLHYVISCLKRHCRQAHGPAPIRHHVVE